MEPTVNGMTFVQSYETIYSGLRGKLQNKGIVISYINIVSKLEANGGRLTINVNISRASPFSFFLDYQILIAYGYVTALIIL